MSKPQATTLKNGLTVITQHVPNEQVYANVTVDVGYRHERPDQDNMAHFLEHLANLGTFENKSERTVYVQNRRGTTNASTSIERTNYKLQVSKEFAEDAVEMLAGRMLNMRFDEDFLKAERNSVEIELRTSVDKPSMINYQRILQTAFPGSQLDKDRFQTVDTVQNHDIDGLKEFADKHYSADNMALAVVGDVKHEDVVAWAEKHFEGLSATPVIPREATLPAAYRGGMKTHVNAEAPEINLSIGFESVGRKDPEAAAADKLLASILGSGSSSRLNRKLVNEKQIARSASAGTSTVTDNGVFVLSATTSAASVKETIDTLAEESTQLADNLTQADLTKAQNRLIGIAERGVEDISDTGDQLAFTQAVDRKLYNLDEELAILKNMTLEQLQSRAREVFHSPPSVTVHGDDLSNLPNYEQISAAFGGKTRHLDEQGLVIQSEAEAAAALARAKAPGKTPVVDIPADAPSPAADSASHAPEVTVLENGLKIVTQKMATKQISANLRVGVGVRDENPSQSGLTSIVRETSNSASQRYDIPEKAEAVANLRGNFGSSSGLESTNFSIRAANEFTGEALRILSENVTSPRFDEENTDKQKKQTQKRITSQKIDPQANVGEQFNRVAFPGSQIDRDVLNSAERVGAQTFEAAKAFKDQYYTADNMILSVVGDVDHAEIVKQAKQLFASVKSQPDSPAPATPPAKYRGGMEVKSNDAKDQVTLRIGFEGSDRSDPKKVATDQLLASILGGGFSSRLLSTLRSQKGLVYSVQAATSPMKDAGSFIIATATQQDKLTETVNTIAEEVSKFAATVTQKELDYVKNDHLGSYERTLSSPESVGSILSTELSRGKVWDVQESIANIKDVTLEDIQRRAKEIFSTAPTVAAFGKGADKIPSYEDISERFGKRRTLDASGLAVDSAPSAQRAVNGSEIAAKPAAKHHAIG